MKPWSHIAIIICLLFIAACDNDDDCSGITGPGSTYHSGAVYGFVKDAGTSEILAGVTVTTDPVSRTATSDSSGLYRLNNIPMGAYVLTFFKSGYIPMKRTLAVQDGEVSLVNAYLSSDDPDTLRFLATVNTGGGTDGIAVRDGIAFAAGDAGLQIFDLTDPGSPSLIGHVAVSSSYIGDVELHGDAAYIANNSFFVEIVNISDPSRPLLASPVSVKGRTHDLELDGDLLLVAANDSLVVLDVSMSLAPVRIGAVATTLDGLGQGNFGVALDREKKVAVLSSFNTGVQMVDYSDPTSPELMGYYGSNINPYDADTDPESSLVVVAGDDGLEFLSYAQPNSPLQLGDWVPGGNGGRDVKLVGSLAIFASTFNGLYVVDISDASKPWRRQRFLPEDIGIPSNVAIDGNRAYVAADNRLVVFALP